MNITIPEGDFEAFIFDCDGTLVDSMPLHHRAWRAAFHHHDAPFDFDEETFYAHAGVPDLEIVRRLNERHGCSLDGHSIDSFKHDYFMEELHTLETVAAIETIARDYHGKLPFAVASGSALELVEPSLKHTNLFHLFDTIVTIEMVEHGKPAPDMFLLCADRLNVRPEACLVFEDGQAGIQAATAAGMPSVFVPRPGHQTFTP
ncbi:MAG: HAD-IA family hydrolase [Verrucomicrobiota bacterium]